MPLKEDEALPCHYMDWALRHRVDSSPSPGSGSKMTVSWRLVSKIFHSIFFQGYFSKVLILQGSHTARRARMGAETVKAPKRWCSPCTFLLEAVASNSVPFLPPKPQAMEEQAWLGNRYIVGTCLPLSLCKLTEPFPSPTSCQEESWWPHSRAVPITAHISPHTLCGSAVFPWTYLSSTPCFVLWRSKTRCPE